MLTCTIDDFIPKWPNGFGSSLFRHPTVVKGIETVHYHFSNCVLVWHCSSSHFTAGILQQSLPPGNIVKRPRGPAVNVSSCWATNRTYYVILWSSGYLNIQLMPIYYKRFTHQRQPVNIVQYKISNVSCTLGHKTIRLRYVP